ncbi:Piwi domain-domain-containing protein [Phakopsora pachyrhizi]|uniref:Piwi domain-domain-containing protein n=1 Tax=Phakopsora pachyrhizi TaxID=170000 RepID=A0AAV0AHW2_PHAPC|nr:Piwi domain-domain-containing protein [Phakopsora pachyrhizi]
MDSPVYQIRFERHPSDTDRSGISQPGTIVDKFIGNPFLYNFFIQSQASLIGTSCPSRYLVLKDETNHTVDDLQNIANLVSSGFQRATKSVKIATPTYYANLVATRAKKWDMSDANGFYSFHNQQCSSNPSQETA